MKKLFKMAMASLMLIAGIGLFTACGENTDPIPDNAKYINNSSELIQAINNQQENEYWVLNEGSYDIDPTQTTINYGEQTGWYVPIIKDGITIRGKGNVTLMSSHDSPNGSWASQNFFTVVGDNVTIRDIKVVCKKDVNKVVEVLGKNVTIKNVTFNAPSDYKFAGSIYFNNSTKEGNEGDLGTATFENVTLNKGRITASGSNTGNVVFKNVNIDWTDIEAKLINGFYPMLNFNGKNFTYEGLNTVSVKMSATEMGDYYQNAVDALVEGVHLTNIDA